MRRGFSVSITIAPTVSGGFFPLDDQLQSWDPDYSEALAKQSLWLCGQVEYAAAQQILDQIGHIPVSETTLWRCVQRWGARYAAQEQLRAQQANALPRRAVRPETPNPKRMGVAMDGAMVNVRTEGWKELKVGDVFEVALRPTTDPETGDVIEQAQAVANSYVAHLGGPDRFGEIVWAEAQHRGFGAVADTEVLGDGAPWIWNQAGIHFGTSLQVVDWYHAKEHLYRAAGLAWGEGTAEAIRWAKRQETPLYQGHAEHVAAALKQLAQQHRRVGAALRTEAGYFESQVRRMQYLERREEGWPIGSGMVESGCKRFRKRFTGSGMRWNRSGLARLLPVRAALLSGRFDEEWSHAYSSPRK